MTDPVLQVERQRVVEQQHADDAWKQPTYAKLSAREARERAGATVVTVDVEGQQQQHHQREERRQHLYARTQQENG